MQSAANALAQFASLSGLTGHEDSQESFIPAKSAAAIMAVDRPLPEQRVMSLGIDESEWNSLE